MRIGKLPTESGTVNIDKWYIGVEIMQYHPSRYYDGFAFKPYFMFMCTKFHPNEEKRIGGWWRFEFPVGIFIKINLI